MAEKRIHIDTLEYTRDGLRTKEPINLKVGEHNRVVLVRPERRKALPFGSGSFEVGSCFPTPGVLSTSLLAAAQNTVNLVLGLNPSSVFQVYGHTDVDGSDTDNKLLSEKRAEVVKAVLLADFAAVQALASEEGWGLHEHQVMLRTLKCDPGAIDGEPGNVTNGAVRLFQYEYISGVFHRHLPEREPVETLEVDGDLNGPTTAALIEAYVLSTSAHLTPEQLHPTHPAVGCSEFNRLDPQDDERNRRVSFVVHSELPPHYDAAPCVAGDAQACPVDSRDPRAGCLWYREHVVDPSVSGLVHRHFDLRWLLLPNDRLMLSALTSLPDGSEIVFQVFRTVPLRRGDSISESSLGEPLSEEIPGLIRGSVAQLAWDYVGSRTLLRPQVEPVPRGLSAEEFLAAETRVRLPVFVVRGGDATTISPPPGREVARMRPELPSVTEDRTGFIGLDWFGGVYQQSSHPAPRSSDLLHPLREDEPMLWAQRHMNRTRPRGES